MNQKIVLSLCISIISAVFSLSALAETFYIKGNSVPIALEITQSTMLNDTVEFNSDLILHLPYQSLSLLKVKGQLWDYNAATEEYESMKLIVSAQDFYSQLFDQQIPLSVQKRGELILTMTEGNDLDTIIPLDSKKRFLQMSAVAGQYIVLGPIEFELAFIQGEAKAGVSLEAPTLYFTGELSGLAAFLSPVSMAGIGLSMNKVFKYKPDTTFGLKAAVKKNMIFNGQQVIMGAGSIPGLPISLTGELVTEYDGLLAEPRRQGFNGNLEASYKFSAELGLSLHLGDASALFVKPTILGSKGPLEMTFSGVQDPTFPFFPQDFPLQPGKEMKIAGLMSSRLERSFFVAHTDFSILNIPLSQGRLNINKNGVFASGFWHTPVSKIGFEGEVSQKKTALKGKAQAKLDVNGVLETVETVTNAAICGTKYVSEGAKCGFEFVFGKVKCAAEKVPHTICMEQCKRTSVGVPQVFSCELRCFSYVSNSCKKAKRCKVAKTCNHVVKIPNTNLGHISADISLLLSNEGLGGDVAAEFCPLKKKCATLPAGQVNLDVSDITKPKVCIGKGTAGSQGAACIGF